MNKYEPFEYAGHRYDIETIAADLEFVGLRRSIEAAKAVGRTLSGIEGMRMEETRDTILKRAHGIHQNSRPGMPDAVCSCGLIVPADVPLDRATGHLDDRLWEPVRTLLVSSTNDWWHEGLLCRAYCQACGWLGEDAPYPEAEQARLAHACEPSR